MLSPNEIRAQLNNLVQRICRGIGLLHVNNRLLNSYLDALINEKIISSTFATTLCLNLRSRYYGCRSKKIFGVSQVSNHNMTTKLQITDLIIV